ncbi:TIMD4 protein, partial [Arenaria interpres]|nr:TIMD4 protein [Arenaria interpres]
HTDSEAVVTGVIGQPVQLPCSYSVVQPKDISDMCWGRGPCPNSKCSDKILHTTRNRVTFRKSQRYDLRGYISYGDVSLTIAKVTAEDAGTYCCRVEIPGWFNDIKQNIRLEVARETTVLLTTTIPPATTATTHHQTTAETTVLTATVPEATSATTKSLAGITLETIVPPTFAVTENGIFPETVLTTSAPPDFSTGFQTADTRTEDDYVFCPTESVPLPGVTTKFPSAFPTAEGTKSADTSLMVEDVPTAEKPCKPQPNADISELLATRPTHSCVNRSEVNMFLKPFRFFSSPFQFPSYAILIACLIALSILFILMLSVFWKRKHTKKFIIKSLGPVEDAEKVFNGAEGENSMFSL